MLLERAAGFLKDHAPDSEVLVLGPTRAAAAELALTAFEQGCQGVHVLTLTQLAASLAAQPMGRGSLAPISRLGAEAIAARVVHSANRAGKLPYFAPVAQTPGFPRAAARTIAELRLNNVRAADLASTSTPGADLAHLLALYEQELEQRSLADLPALLQLATEEARQGGHRFLNLPLLLLDLSVDSLRHQELLAAVAATSGDVLATAISGDNPAISTLESALGLPADDLDFQPETTLDRVRHWLFSPEQPPAAPPDPELLFSAPGESLECVEIARRIRAAAESGTPFDRMAILLRNVDQYQPLVEEALRRASIPGYFGRGAVRPEPSGRAFLALLACAAERCSASRFAEYLSLGQVPALDETGAPQKAAPVWVPPADDVLGSLPAPPPGSAVAMAASDQADTASEWPTVSAPIGWEKLLVDAAVIGGHGRWARRLRGLQAELETQLRDLDKEDQSHRPHVERRIEQLARLEHFALPLIDALDLLPKSANWGEWLEALDELARLALTAAGTGALGTQRAAAHGRSRTSLARRSLRRSVRAARVRCAPNRRGAATVKCSSDPSKKRAVARTMWFSCPAWPRACSRAGRSRIRCSSTSIARSWMHRSSCALIASRANVCCCDLPRPPPSNDWWFPIRAWMCHKPVRACRRSTRSKWCAPPRADCRRCVNSRSVPQRVPRHGWIGRRPTDPEIAIDDAEYDLASLQVALELSRSEAKGSARFLVETNPSLARSLRSRSRRWRNRWTPADGVVDPDAATRAVLEQHGFAQHSYSASALQLFSSCPYRFLLHSILQLRPREASVPLEQMDPLTRGALFHAVQFDLFRDLSRTRRLPVTPERLPGALDLVDQVLDRVAAKFEDDLAPAIPRVWKSEVEEVRTDLRGWLQQVAATQSEWLPVHFEFAFGLAPDEHRDPASSTGEAVILDGIRLRGAIDLVERHADPRRAARRRP